ncbi:MAG: ATP-binding protein [Spirochaetota bacterium]
MAAASDIAHSIYFNFYALCAITPALFLLIIGLMFLRSPGKSRITRHLAACYLGMFIFYTGYFIGAAVYHPIGAYHRWITFPASLVCFTLWTKFFSAFPSTAKKTQTRIFFPVMWTCTILLSLAYIIASANGKVSYIFSSHCYDFDSPRIEKASSFIIFIFFAISSGTGLYRSLSAKKPYRLTCVAVASIFAVGIFIPTLVNIMSKYGIVSRGAYQLSQDFSSLLAYFFTAILYINASPDRTTVLTKITAIAFATFLILFQLIGFVSQRDADKAYNLFKTHESQLAALSGNYPSDLAFLAKKAPDSDTFSILYSRNGFTGFKKDAKARTDFSRYRTGVHGENYICYEWKDAASGGIMQAGYDYRGYRKFIHPASAALMIILIAVIIITIAGFRVFFLGAIIQPLSSLQNGIREIGKGNFRISLPVTSNDELGEITRIFNSMAARIEDYNRNMTALVGEKTAQLLHAEKMASLGGMISGMAHEINTPIGISLTAITAAIIKTDEIKEQAAKGGLSKSGFDSSLSLLADTLSLTESNLKKAAVLITNFKSLALGKRNDEKKVFNVAEYVNAITAGLMPAACERQIETVVDIGSSLLINSYPELFTELVANLFLNAVIHGFDAGEKGIIRISASRTETAFTLVVHNNGRMILRENLTRIFDPFFTTKRNEGKTGLGLNIVYNIVTYSLNGAISYESSEDNGTTATVQFPVDALPETTYIYPGEK